MLVGLQGSGKTTTCGKLAKWARGQGKNPLLVSFDLKRPAAQDQLRMIAGSLGFPFYEMTPSGCPIPTTRCANWSAKSENRGYDLLLVDTAGRLHVDEELMEELRWSRTSSTPVEVIYVGDAMTGQDAVKSAQAFAERIGLTSIILTKLDGDARGGAALSIVSVTGKPIKFVGVGEKFDKLEVFHPDRMASRILGMGDILSLIEKAEQETDVRGGRGAGPQDPQAGVHPRGFQEAARSAQEDGLALGPARAICRASGRSRISARPRSTTGRSSTSRRSSIP